MGGLLRADFLLLKSKISIKVSMLVCLGKIVFFFSPIAA